MTKIQGPTTKYTRLFQRAITHSALIFGIAIGFSPRVEATKNYPAAAAEHFKRAQGAIQKVVKKDSPNKPFKASFEDGKTHGFIGKVTKLKDAKTKKEDGVLVDPKGKPFIADDKINDLGKFQIKNPAKFKLVLEFWLFKFWKDREATESHFSPYINGKQFAEYTHRHKKPLANAKQCKIVQDDVAFEESGFAGTKIRCIYDGEYTAHKRLNVNGKDVSNARTPTSHQFSVKDYARSPKGRQAWAISSFEINFDGISSSDDGKTLSDEERLKAVYEMKVPKKIKMTFVLPEALPMKREHPEDEMVPSKRRKVDSSQHWPPGQTPFASYPGEERASHPDRPSQLDYVPPDRTIPGDQPPMCSAECFKEGKSKQQIEHCERNCVVLEDDTAEAMYKAAKGSKRQRTY